MPKIGPSAARRIVGKVLLLALFMVPTACSGGARTGEDARGDGPTRTDARPRDAEEPAVLAALEALTGAIESENTFAFLERVSDRYAPSPLALKAEADAMLLDHLGYVFHLRVTHFHREDWEATMIVEWRYGRSHRRTGLFEWKNGIAELRFIHEANRWKLLAQAGDRLFEAPSPS